MGNFIGKWEQFDEDIENADAFFKAAGTCCVLFFFLKLTDFIIFHFNKSRVWLRWLTLFTCWIFF